MSSSQQLSILSLNVNGLNDVRKRRLAFTALRKHKRSIILLEETHCRPSNARLLRSQLGHDMLLTVTSASLGGVAILFSRDLKLDIKETHFSNTSRFIMWKVQIEGYHLRIFNVYMPTSDKEGEQIQLLEEISSLLRAETEVEETAILGGDFNVSMSESLDRKGYSSSIITNISVRSTLLETLQSLNLCDIWRIQNPTKKSYTWSRGLKLARLD